MTFSSPGWTGAHANPAGRAGVDSTSVSWLRSHQVDTTTVVEMCSVTVVLALDISVQSGFLDEWLFWPSTN